MLTYNEKIAQDIEVYVEKHKQHLPVDIVDKFRQLLAVVTRQEASLRALRPGRQNPDWLHERNQEGGVPVPQKCDRGSWVDA
jgi:hypothetical protein